MRKAIIGLDFGTSKLAVVIIDPESKEVIDSRSIESHAYIDGIEPYKKEQDINKIDSAFYALMESSLKGKDLDVLSIGLTGQMHGIIGLNEKGKPVTNLVTWQDERGNVILEEGITLLNKMEQKGGKRPIASGYAIVTLFDYVNNGLNNKISKICTLSDYFGMTLSGVMKPVISYQMADSLGCFNINSNEWDNNYLKNLGIKKDYFPEVVSSTTVVGELKDNRFLRLIDRRKGIPISVSIGDNQASFLGSVRDYFNSILVNIGTASQISYGVKSLKECKNTEFINGYDVVVRPFVEGTFLIAGNALSGGVIYTCLKNFFVKVASELFDIEADEKIWRKMEEIASKEVDNGGLIVYPLFYGKRSKPNEKGKIIGIDIDNFTPSKLIYSTLAGMGTILLEMVEEKTIEDKDFLIGSGNGIRRNNVFKKILSNVFKKDMLVPLYEEEAAIGAALNGAVAAGIFKNFQQARKVIKLIE